MWPTRCLLRYLDDDMLLELNLSVKCNEIDTFLDAGSTCFGQNRSIIQSIQMGDLVEIGHSFIQYSWCDAVYAFQSLCNDVSLDDDLFTMRVTGQREQLAMTVSSLIRHPDRNNRSAFIAGWYNDCIICGLARFAQLRSTETGKHAWTCIDIPPNEQDIKCNVHFFFIVNHQRSLQTTFWVSSRILQQNGNLQGPTASTSGN